MRILVLSPHFPSFPSTGAPARLYCLLRESASRHQFHLLASSTFGGQADPQRLAPLVESWEEVRPAARPSGRLPRLVASVRRRLGSTPRLVEGLLPLRNHAQELIRRALTAFRPDVIQVEHTITLPLLEGIRELPPILTVAHDLVFRIQERATLVATEATTRADWAEQARRTRALETRLFRSGGHFVTCSEEDRAALQDLAPAARVTVVPNGVDVDYFGPSPPGSPQRLVFTGNMQTLPNVDAVDWFCREVMVHLPEVSLDIVGLNPSREVQALAGPRVAVHGSVPDVRPFISAAGVFVVPLRIGSGTRLKILEAMAMGRPVVSTRVGAEGLGLRQGEEALLADTPREFAQAVSSLVTDEALRGRLAERGRRLVEERFSWAVLAPAMERAYEECVALHA